MDMVLEWLATEAGAALFLALLGAGFAALWQWRKIGEWKLERAVQCLEAGVRTAYEEYVRRVKLSGDGRKLSPEERREAMRQALFHAGEYARREGVDLARQFARDYLPVLVEKIIRRDKGDAGRPLDG